MTVDVIVAGGGSAGLAAAVAAARAGAKTLLIERTGALGGMVTASLVHSICGLYRLTSGPDAKLGHSGFPVEFAQRLLATGGAHGPVRLGRVDILLQQPVAFARVADEFAGAEKNLTVRFHTELSAVEASDGAVHSVEILCRGLREQVAARAFVDTTGDGTLAWLAGAEYELAPTLQRPAFIFGLAGVAAGAVADEARMRVAQQIVAGVRAGEIPQGALGAHFRQTVRSGEVFVTLDLDNPEAGPVFNPLCPDSLGAMEAYGRQLASALAVFLQKEAEGFSDSYIAAFPARVGIRESRRICGEYQINADDIVNGSTFGDAVAVSTWPIEMREQATGPRLRFPEGNRSCDIPLRALRVRGFENLFVAGRCLSSSHEAQAALRVIGTCLAMGEAAGIAAGLKASGTEPTAAGVNAARVLSMKNAAL